MRDSDYWTETAHLSFSPRDSLDKVDQAKKISPIGKLPGAENVVQPDCYPINQPKSKKCSQKINKKKKDKEVEEA